MATYAQPGRDALAGLGAQLEQYLAAPGDTAALDAARAGLRRLLDTLKAARMHGVAAFCAELEAVLGELSSRPGLLSGLHRDVLQQAMLALARHLDALADGADDAALLLFPEYQALQQLRGQEMSFELDLFHPGTDVQLPQQIRDAPQESGDSHRLKFLRSQYQLGLLHWLRGENPTGALQAMQHALGDTMRCMPQDASRAFWWVACALLECLTPDRAEPEVNRLLGRIDQQMRVASSAEPHAVSTGEGHAGETLPVLNEMLYRIGRSGAAGELAETVRQTYMLEFYLPGIAGLPPDAAAPVLDAMRGQLEAAEESWERCVQGSRAACEEFIGHAGNLAVHGDKLGRNALQYLAGQVHALSQYAQGPEHARLISLDMAMALLLLGSGIRRYGKLNSGFLKAAHILGERIRVAARQQPEDAEQLAELARLHCQLQLGDVKVHLFNEMLANLRYIEQGLSAFCGDPAGRNELGELLRLAGQIRGGLHIASLEQAERLLAAIEGGLRRFAQSDDVPGQAESRALADAVNALESYLRRLAHRQAGDASALEKALDGMAALQQAPAPAPAAPQQPAAIPHPQGEDQELLEVFLEEAQEVLHNLRNDLEACGLRLEREPLVNIRRGFHTLKGSGRMVGLSDLGEVAWNVERALNKWLQANRPVTPELLRFIAEAERKFTGWVDALNSQGGVDIEAGGLIAAAQRIESGAGPEAAPEEPAKAAPEKTAAPPAAPAEAIIVPAPAPLSTGMPAAAEKPQPRDDLDAQLLPVFLEEADELFPQIAASLRAWREQPDDERQPQRFRQLLHTFKGSARMAGAMRLGSIAHEMEGSAPATAQAEPWDDLEAGLDRIAGLLEKLRSGEAPAYAGAERRKERRTVEAGADHAMLRVRADLLDRLVNEAGEIGMARARMETEMQAFKEGLQELTGSVVRLRRQLRELEMHAESRMQAGFTSFPPLPSGGEGDRPLSREREITSDLAALPPSRMASSSIRVGARAGEAQQFDPLEFDRFTRLQELTRFLNESAHDVQTVQHALLKNFDAAATALAAQARLNRELQQNLMNVRMVPFASIAERLYRVVRQTAKELHKRANLELSGTELELDRSVLEKMTAPFEHLLRNALAHGIESEAVRQQGGKHPIGEIRLALRREGNEVVFEFGDDGAGLDFAALREKAIARGLLGPDEPAGDDRLAQLIFTSGISTASGVTEVAGRGIGMGVVCGAIAALGGRIAVSSHQGSGTQFTIRLPLTLAVTHVLMVRSGNTVYAIPSATVKQVRQEKPEELAQFYRDGRIEWQDESYPLHYLPHLLGEGGSKPEDQRHSPVLLLRSGEQRIALHVDGLLGNREAMVKNTGPQLAQLPVIAGATVQGDGTVALILNPAQLAQRVAAPPPGATAPEEPRAGPLVMIVDDSLTVRKITSRLLARAGYRVAAARDGMDALEQLGESLPDVMLLDIEMPRMDGFELTKHLRRDARTQSLPIIMITSRAADKHRDYALQLGVNAYLGKPYQEEELLRQVAAFVAISAGNCPEGT